MHVLDDVFAETDRFINKEKHRIRSWWFVTAHTVNGSRFYSRAYEKYEEAADYFEGIKDMIKYFGGGMVELLRINDYDYDVVAISRI